MRLAYLVGFLVLLFATFDHPAAAKFRSSSRTSRSSVRYVRYPSVRTSSSSKGRTYTLSRRKSVSRYSSYTKAAAAGYTVSGFNQYRSRFTDSSQYSSDPPVCYTTDPGRFDNHTLTSHLGYFVCPYNQTSSLSKNYCCGDEDRQYCCEFWDESGRLAGAISGLILVVIITFIIVFLVWRFGCKRKQNSSNISPNGNASSEEIRKVTPTFSDVHKETYPPDYYQLYHPNSQPLNLSEDHTPYQQSQSEHQPLNYPNNGPGYQPSYPE